MNETQTPGDAKLVSTQINEAHERLRQLETKDRRHWIAAVIVITVLAATAYAGTFPAVAQTLLSGNSAKVAVRTLALLAAVFAMVALQRQRFFAVRRREAASEIAVIPAAETLRAGMGKPGAETERRGAVRVGCNQRLVVRTHDSDGLEVYYGRILDICEHGLGAIVPSVMESGQEVLLEFSLIDSSRTPSTPLKLSAIVRQRSGFRYGFNFVAIGETAREQIESYRGADRVVSIKGRSAAASDSGD